MKAVTRKSLHSLEVDHERDSHEGVSFDDWIESIITHAEYFGYVASYGNPIFWKAFRGDKKPVFSGLRGRGE